MNERKKRNVILSVLVGIICLMGIGYAAFSTQLNITGTSNITSNFDVRITNIDSELFGATNIEEPTFDNTNGLYASFSAGLTRPGDYALYTVTIENRGDIDARIEKINTYYEENEYVTFTISGLNKGDVIGGSEIKELLVRVEFNSDVSSIDGDITIDLDISLDLAQDSDNPLPADEYYVVYDYETNAGESSNAVNGYVAENTNINLGYTATKTGYEFMGWNTNKDATDGLDTLSMPGNNITLYAIFRKIDTTPPVIENVSTSSTTNSITVVTTATETDGEITKYEYSLDNESYVEGENTYTFTGLTQNTAHTIKVKVTNRDNLTVESQEYSISTKELNVPTFSEVETETGKTVTISYPEGEGLIYEYKKDNGDWLTATQNQKVEFTKSGTLIARVSDGTNVVTSSTYTVSIITYTPGVATDVINQLLATNPDELYTDEHGDIRYYGANPNNYVRFNNELWRIMGVIDGKIKIVRNESIGDMKWNSSRSNNWNNSSLKSYLNGDYYNSIEEVSRNMIASETYYLGGATNSNYKTLTASEYYNAERSTTVYSGNPTSTTQYIGLMYPSDYGYAAGESCLSTALYDYVYSCKNTDYLHKGVDQWLQAPIASNSTGAACLSSTGFVNGCGNVTISYAVFPVLYLESQTMITGGEGSSDSPFILG